MKSKEGTSVTSAEARVKRLTDIKSHVDAALARVEQTYSQPGHKAHLTAPYDPNETATIAKRAGATTAEAKALSTKTTGESGGRPGAVGHDPGGTTGLGLWQLTTGVGNDELINRHGGPQAMLKPKPNAAAALELLRSGGLSNWYAPSTAPGNPIKESPHAKPNKADTKLLRKYHVRPTRGGSAAPAPGSNKHPFKKAVSKMVGGSGIKSPKWAPGEQISAAINPVVKAFAKKYGAHLNAGYDPGGGHVSSGHNVTGTATDLVPTEDTPAGWDRLEKGLRVLADSGFEVLYGTNGIGHAYPNHGRNNHAHVEWADTGNGWSAQSQAAMQKLAGLSGSEMKVMAKHIGTGSGYNAIGGVSSSAAVSAYATATGVSLRTAQKVRKNDPKAFRHIVQKALARVRTAYSASNQVSLTRPSRAHGKPVE